MPSQDYFASSDWSDRTVYIVNDAAGTACDLNSSDNGAPVHAWEHQVGNDNQRWTLEKVNRASSWSPWRVRSSRGVYLEIGGDNIEDGAQANGWAEAWNNRNQQWYLISPDGENGDRLMLQNAASYTYLDLNRGERGNGVKIHGWHRNDGTAQLWRFIKA